MREAEVGLNQEALQDLGFDTGGEAASVDILDVTLLACDGAESLSVTTFSDPVDDLLSSTDGVEWYERLHREDSSVRYLCKTVATDLPDGSPQAGTDLIVQDISPDGNGGFRLSLVGTQEAINSELGDCAPIDAPIELHRIGEYDGPCGPADRITLRQREVLETAYDLGYYEVPRQAKASDIADSMGLDRSTVTEHLQRAERRLVTAALS